MKKLLYIFLMLTACNQFALADIISNYQIPSTYLDNGKLKVNSSSATPFKVTVGFTRFLLGGSNTWESVNIYFKIVAFNNATGQVISDLTNWNNVTSTSFTDPNGNTISKTYDVNINFSSLGVTAQNLRIALLWVSNAYPAPPGSPLGANIYSTLYQVTVVTPPTSPDSNKFMMDDATGLVYWFMEGKYRLIYYRSEYELFGSSYQTYVDSKLTHTTGQPTPLGDPIGWLNYDDSHPNAFLIKKDNVLYYVEEKLVNPANPDAYQIYYYLRKASDDIKSYYHFVGTPYTPTFTFSSTPVVNGFVLGPDLGYN